MSAKSEKKGIYWELESDQISNNIIKNMLRAISHGDQKYLFKYF